MDKATLGQPAEPTGTAHPPRPPMATIAIGIEHRDGTMMTVTWDIPPAAAEQEIIRLRDRYGPTNSSMISSAEEATAAAAFIVKQGLRIDL